MGLKRSPILRKTWPFRRRIKPRPRTTRLAREERGHKDEARIRDKFRCRFPLCGCQRWLDRPMKKVLTVSHDKHKGMGGDPTGERSRPPGLVTLCKWRHQDGKISRQAGNLRAVALTDRGNDGPIAWEIDLTALKGVDARWFGPSPGPVLGDSPWIEVARERDVQQLEPLLPWQRAVLEKLAEMEL
jgi:hypothetical protein